MSKKSINDDRKYRYANNIDGYRDKERARLSKYRHTKEYLRNYRDKKRFGYNRYLVLDRDGNKCTKCGSAENLHVHHKDGSGQTENPNHDMSNLTTLCLDCHSKTHGKELRKGKTIQCDFCKKDVYVKTKYFETKKHCSKYCQMESKKLEKLAMTKNCLVCNAEFVVFESQLLSGGGKYCSKKCNGIGVTTKVKVNCIRCNAEFEVVPAQVKRGRAKYCSRLCLYNKNKAL